MGLLFVDSVLMLCSNFTTMQLERTPLLNPDLIRLRQIVCKDQTWVNWGNTQYDWVIETLAAWDNNPQIIWRAAIQHYPMFPLWYPASDFAQIPNYFLPILQQHKFDLYLCGHEHILAYTAVPYPATEQVFEGLSQSDAANEVCLTNTEEWFGNP
jgi:hypothetical protein